MLVLERSVGASVRVGDVMVTVLQSRGRSVRLGFEGDRSIPILRSELESPDNAEPTELEGTEP